ITHNYIRFVGDFAGVFLHLLARKLREQGMEIHVVAPHDATMPEKEEIQGIKIYRFRYASDDNETFAYRGDMHRQLFKNPFKIFRLLKFLRSAAKVASEVIEKENIGIVAVHWLVPNAIIGRRLKRKYKDNIRLFLHSHGTDVRLLTGVPMAYSYLKSAIKMSERWTVVSSYLKSLVTAKDDSIGDNIDIIPLPNDEKIFYPDDNTLEDPNLVVAVSRLTAQKRIDLLLKAIKIVSEKRPNVKLGIYGSGPEKVHFESLIKELGLEGRAKIHKPVDQRDLRQVYNKAALVVLNSVDEGFGLALTEAMLCETAVIGTRSGGIIDIIDDEKTGLLVEPDNIEALAGAILRLLQDSTLRQRLGEAGYEKARECFSSEASAARFAAIFRGE
ncbi:MAG: glycosyltransferase, partial [Candidatus Zixiibacteriota bacterium]